MCPYSPQEAQTKLSASEDGMSLLVAAISLSPRANLLASLAV